MVGEFPARHVPDVQLHAGAACHQGVRCIGHGVAAARTIAQQKVNVLTGPKLEAVIGGQLQLDHHHIVRSLGQAHHAHRHFADGIRPFFNHLARLQHQVRSGCGAAGEHIALFFFGITQGLALVLAHEQLAADFFAFARSAGAVFAAIGQAYALAQTGAEQGLVGFCREMAAAGLDRDAETHVWLSLGLNFLQRLRFCLQTKPRWVPCPPAFAANDC